jgi:hypothetical protein
MRHRSNLVRHRLQLSLQSALATVIITNGGLGCGGSPSLDSLDGTWSFTTDTLGLMGSGEIIFSTDGTLAQTGTIGGCTGTLSFSGTSWSATSTVLHVSGTSMCMGTLTCTSDGKKSSMTCPPDANSPLADGNCNYVLSDAGQRLTLSHCVSKSGFPSMSDLVLAR